eukprot:gene39058-48241_t
MSETDHEKARNLVVNRFLKMVGEEAVAQNPNGFRPVYRLDYMVEGLCLYTNSGDFARLLNADGSKFGKHFRIRVHGLITESKLEGLRKGLFIGTITWLNVTSYDHRNQALKKSFDKLFLKMTRVICVGFGDLKLDEVIPVNSALHCKEIKFDVEMNQMYLKMM